MRSDATELVEYTVKKRLYVDKRLVVVIKNRLEIVVGLGSSDFACCEVQINRHVQNFRALAELKEGRYGVFFYADKRNRFKLQSYSFWLTAYSFRSL